MTTPRFPAAGADGKVQDRHLPDRLSSDGLSEAAVNAMSMVSVVDFGAQKSPANATQAFKDAIVKAREDGVAVFVPKGSWTVDPDAIVLEAGQKMVGAGPSLTTIISSEQYVGAGVTLKYGAELSGAFIRGYSEGVKSKGCWVKAHDLKLSYNTVGFHAESLSYICKVWNNEITFNRGIGVLIGGESYQFDLHHNIIDNNRGIGVLIYSTSGGIICSDNTIEGNRDFTTGFGCGMYVIGANLSRLAIENNWFEANGNTPESVDVFFPMVEGPFQAIGNQIRSELIPESHLDLIRDGSNGSGSIVINKNAFIFTPNNLALGFGAGTAAEVRGNTFKGRLDVYNRHILLNINKTGLYRDTTLTISDNGHNNTDNAAGINPQVTTGLGGTIVHSGERTSVMTGVTVDGKPYFEKWMTFAQVSAEFGFSPKSLHRAGVEHAPTRKLINTQTSGYTSLDTAAVVGDSNASGQLLPFAGRKIIVLGEPGSTVRYQTTASWRAREVSTGYRKFTVIDVPPAEELSTGTLYASIGATVYGWVVVPKDKEYLLTGFSEITISDWASEPIVPEIPAQSTPI